MISRKCESQHRTAPRAACHGVAPVALTVGDGTPRAPAGVPLLAGGFDRTQQTVFLLEGVTLYLTRDEVLRTLRLAQSIAPPGSVVLMDLYSSEVVALAQRPLARRLLALTDEELHFGVDFRHAPLDEVDKLVSDAGLARGRVELLAPDRRGGAYFAIVECRFSE